MPAFPVRGSNMKNSLFPCHNQPLLVVTIRFNMCLIIAAASIYDAMQVLTWMRECIKNRLKNHLSLPGCPTASKQVHGRSRRHRLSSYVWDLPLDESNQGNANTSENVSEWWQIMYHFTDGRPVPVRISCPYLGVVREPKGYWHDSPHWPSFMVARVKSLPSNLDFQHGTHRWLVSFQ